MRLPRIAGRTGLIGVLVLSLLTALPSPAHALPDVGSAQQLVLVTAKRWSATTGTVQTFERNGNGKWRSVLGPVPALLGSGGLVPGEKRLQGRGQTPVGTYRVLWGFGRKPNPGTTLRYRTIDRTDAWPYNPADPATYNVFQTAAHDWRSYGRYVERLWSYGKQYNYVAVLDYNLPNGAIRRDFDGIWRTDEPANTRRGGGIFLHASNGKPTAGCIAVDEPAMRTIMRWLDPKRSPVVVIDVR
jgi:L,D-peptidoglycan transpeptidase YkuD (ErfK/YbiS/YcfS/YnhG family)